MAVLVVVFAVLVVSYASSLHAYLQQQSHLSSLRTQIAMAQHNIAREKRERARWKDKAYVEQQARERFGWVLPGQTAYQVVGADGRPVQGSNRLDDPTLTKPPVPTAWWTRAYGSLEQADHPAAYAKPTPLSKITAPGSKHRAGH